MEVLKLNVLQVSQLNKSFGNRVLFQNISFSMDQGEKLGLCGRNGHGKSTLFKILKNEVGSDSGVITYPKNYSIGFLEQHLDFQESSVIDEACLGLPEQEKEDIYKAQAILTGLGFSEDDWNKPPSSFSGGYQIRINLAKVLISRPNLLLLDEPTNYLDIVSMRWLAQFLRSWRNEFILITHDRSFMDLVTTHTMIIHRKGIKKIKGDTFKLYQQLEQEEEIYEKTRLNDEKKQKQMENFVEKFRAKAGTASLVQSRIKMLEKQKTMNKLETIDNLYFQFKNSPIPAKYLYSVENLSFGYRSDQILIDGLSFSVANGDRIGVIGKNGKGKSTLLNILSKELNPTDGILSPHPGLKIGYFGQTNIQRLDPSSSIEEEIQASNSDLSRTEIRGICGTMMFQGDSAEKKIKVLSGGEKSRVMLGKILATPSNFLFLDEPTNHLDMESVESLTNAIKEFDGSVMMVTHSEKLLRETVNKLIIFNSGKVTFFDGNYDQFLEKIGWDEEFEKKSKNKKSYKKEAKKARDQVIRERSLKLKPLKAQIEALEVSIHSLESQIKEEQVQLVQASEVGNVELIKRLSVEIKQNEIEVENLFTELTEVHQLYDEAKHIFDRRLDEI